MSQATAGPTLKPRPLRILVRGGLHSYRALFSWLSPWIYIPSLLIAPLFQVALFVYIGRNAGIGSDEFFVIGNAIQYCSIPCFFAMTQTIAGERSQRTLAVIFCTPAPRLPLFLGRSLPVVLNGWLVALCCLAVSTALFGLDIRAAAWPPLFLIVAVAAASCTGFGLILAAIGLRVRATAVLSNIVFGLLLILCGANVPSDQLPAAAAWVGQLLPLTRAIEAARDVADGASLGQVSGLVWQEAAVGCLYAAIGLVVLAVLERSARRHGSLDRA